MHPCVTVGGLCVCVCVNTDVLSEKVCVCVSVCTTFLYLRSESLLDGVCILYIVCVIFLVISRPAELSFPVISVQSVFVSGSLGGLWSVCSSDDLLQVKWRAVLL